MVSLVRGLHHDGCTRGWMLMILSLMAVREAEGPGVSVVAMGLLANGWSQVGAASQVVGRAGKSEEL